MERLKHFDLFSGFGGFSLALERVYAYLQSSKGLQQGWNNTNRDLSDSGKSFLGEKPLTIGFSEIDKYASAVLKWHWPNIKNYGDIKKIEWDKVPDFDLLTGGSPCQDLSIAGKCAGLEGERSGLFYEYMRAVREKKPKYFIWENVKGALSSNQGRDFALVLNEMAEAGYSLWWQILNAKDFGVPQNRERIFVVGFRDRSAPEVFFERGSNEEINLEVVGNTNNCGRGDRGRIFDGSGVVAGLTATDYKQPKQIKVVGTLDGAGWEKRNESIRRVHSPEGIAPTTPTGTGGGVMTKVAIPVLTPDRLEKRQNGRRMKEDGEPSFTLTSQDKHGVAIGDILERKEDSLGRQRPVNYAKHLSNGLKIRRLTPTECERLMGLPDDWLKYGINEKGEQFEISDTQRYKMAGNGVVVNVVEEIIKVLIHP